MFCVCGLLAGLFAGLLYFWRLLLRHAICFFMMIVRPMKYQLFWACQRDSFLIILDFLHINDVLSDVLVSVAEHILCFKS